MLWNWGSLVHAHHDGGGLHHGVGLFAHFQAQLPDGVHGDGGAHHIAAADVDLHDAVDGALLDADDLALILLSDRNKTIFAAGFVTCFVLALDNTQSILCGRRLAWHKSISQIFVYFLSDNSINRVFHSPIPWFSVRNRSGRRRDAQVRDLHPDLDERKTVERGADAQSHLGHRVDVPRSTGRIRARTFFPCFMVDSS